jgi:prepilin peptidase CpaA
MHSFTDLVLLSGILATAVYSDLRWHRIPNWLSVTGLVAGLVLQTVATGAHGLVSGVLGAGVGLVCFAPLYLLRAMGAGDVKLLAAVGCFMGPQGAFYAAAGSLLAGGAGAIGYVLWRVARAVISTLVREGLAAAGAAALIAATIARRDRLPFALPIAVGGITAWVYENDAAGLAALVRGGNL